MVELLPSKQTVAGSSPVPRSITSLYPEVGMRLIRQLLCFLGVHELVPRRVGVRRSRKVRIHHAQVCVHCGEIVLGDPLR